MRSLRQSLVEQLSALESKAEALREEIQYIDAFLKHAPVGEHVDEIAEPIRRIRPEMTMKALVLEALEQHFPQGANVGDLLRCFSDIYKRSDIARTSLSPQLTRLKEEGQIVLDGRTWRLVRNG